MSNKETDQARYEDALKAKNNSDWDTAITKFQALSSDFLNQEAVLEQYAGALAGKCGLNFITYTNSLGSSTIDSSTPFFKYLMNAFTGKAVSPAHCTTAEMVMKQIKTMTGTWTTNQTFFVLILSMVKMGTYIRNKADVDGTGNLGDGNPDATINLCRDAEAGDATTAYLTDTEIKEIITGFALMLQNFAAFSANLGGAGDALATISATCGPPLNLTFCSKTDAAGVDATDVKGMRSILSLAYNAAGLSAVGIGSTTVTAATNPNGNNGVYWGCTPASLLCCP
ncbi:MAG: hypothetical protein BroJett040_22060 [Oligoflexia bacterium]|nr:MAG: hypothetical protein BroJett040_22060 [Oligoflexia bacterium]